MDDHDKQSAQDTTIHTNIKLTKSDIQVKSISQFAKQHTSSVSNRIIHVIRKLNSQI